MGVPVNKLESLRRILGNFAGGKLQSGPINIDFLGQIGAVRAKLGPGDIRGVNQAGMEGVHSLCETLIKEPAYSRGSNFDELVDVVLRLVLDQFYDERPAKVGEAEVAALEARLSAWLREGAADRILFLPCMLARTPTADFGIGPIRFQNAETFIAEVAVPNFNEHGVERLTRDMRQAGATWIAHVPVPDCREAPGWHLAEVGVDLALAGLQLIVPLKNSEWMARLHGRPRSGRVIRLGIINDRYETSFQNREPGRTLGAGAFEKYLSSDPEVLAAIGRRVASFLDGSIANSLLDRAWCDAAYWFHGGLAEPLGSLAVPMLETAIEVLLGAGSSAGGERRLIDAIWAFYGLAADGPINPTSHLTVKQFAHRFVEERSRILHGTRSTLQSQLGTSRDILAELTADFLRCYAVSLDRYRASGAARDDIQSFLDWIRPH